MEHGGHGHGRLRRRAASCTQTRARSGKGSLREARSLARKQAGLSQFFSPVVLEALADQDAEVVLQPFAAIHVERGTSGTGTNV